MCRKIVSMRFASISLSLLSDVGSMSTHIHHDVLSTSWPNDDFWCSAPFWMCVPFNTFRGNATEILLIVRRRSFHVPCSCWMRPCVWVCVGVQCSQFTQRWVCVKFRSQLIQMFVNFCRDAIIIISLSPESPHEHTFASWDPIFWLLAHVDDDDNEDDQMAQRKHKLCVFGGPCHIFFSAPLFFGHLFLCSLSLDGRRRTKIYEPTRNKLLCRHGKGKRAHKYTA